MQIAIEEINVQISKNSLKNALKVFFLKILYALPQVIEKLKIIITKYTKSNEISRLILNNINLIPSSIFHIAQVVPVPIRIERGTIK